MNSSFNAIQEQFIFWLDTLGFSKSSIRKYGTKSREFFDWLTVQNITSINLLNQHHINTFFEYQQTRNHQKQATKLSSVYLNDYFTGIDKLLEFLHQMGAKNTPSPTNHRVIVDQEKRVRKIETFTIEEIKLLQSQILELYPNYDYKRKELKHYQLKLVFALCYGCGLRMSEAFKLTPKDLNFDKKTIFVHQGKNYKDRIVPMSASIYNALQDYMYNFRNLEKCGHNRLFIQSPTAINTDLRHLHSQCNESSIQNKRFNFHILRHSIATHLLQNGMPIENISRFLGHSSLASTQIYTHIVNR